jgi:16S rRNA (guanine966-N2)-methyltransferase
MGKSDKSRNRVRIIAGSHRSRLISFADRPGLRPTGDRIRETLFNWLQLDVAGARCLDLFAGSGILGLEALSRGAIWVDFVDADRQVCQDIDSNLKLLGIRSASVICSDALGWLGSNACSEPYDVIFLDPPFGSGLLENVLNALRSKECLSDHGKIYVECDRRQEAGLLKSIALANWHQLRLKRAGEVSFMLYQRDN